MKDIKLQTIDDEVEANPELKRMINEGQEQYKKGMGMSTTELLESLCPENFENKNTLSKLT